jgi:hypothetical protein
VDSDSSSSATGVGLFWLPGLAIELLAVPFAYIAIILTLSSHRLGPRGGDVQLETGGRFAFVDLFDDPRLYDGRIQASTQSRAPEARSNPPGGSRSFSSCGIRRTCRRSSNTPFW